jgi:soluble lytic murein transglycosylase
MGFIHRVVAPLGLLIAATLVVGWTSVRPADTANPPAVANARFMLAQLLPFERNKVEPIDVRKAFVEGYEAYKRRDFLAVIGRMQLAATNLPELADYALFYLGSAERDNGDMQNAADTFRRLTLTCPQSVLADAAGVEYARLELKLGHPEFALPEATRVADRTIDPAVEQNARLVMAHALLATNDFRAAYGEAQTIRQKFPGGSADPEARALAYSILTEHPQVDNTSLLEYHSSEASLLLREGQSAMALRQIRAGLALEPPLSIRTELTWLLAGASRGNPEAARAAFAQYLALAPGGPHAPAALSAIAHLYWRTDDTADARYYFARIVRDFPASALAPNSMFEIGRTYEDDGALESARAEYLRLVKRYPGSEVATDARFREAFMLYLLKRYDEASEEFSEARARAAAGSERDMFGYWEARALEQSGENVEARKLMRTVALSSESNYYPGLAATRVDVSPDVLPAAAAPDLFAGTPPAAEGLAQFHLNRVVIFRELDLRELEPAELRAVEANAGASAALRYFVLAEFQNSGAWYDAIVLATRMAARGEISKSTAERVRYPRGFWDLISGTAGSHGLDPYLLAALIRQESLFNPQARSVSDARGLMQLLPSTAERYAASAGVAASPLDLFDPTVSVQLGATYLRALLGMFGGDMFKAVAAYNGGEHAVAGWIAKYPGDDDQWVENIGFHETRDYVKKVIGGMREYQLLYQSRSGTPTSIPAPQSSG